MNKKTAILIGVSAAAFLGPFTQTIYTPSLPEMKDFFGVTTVMINLTISLFTIILATSNFIVGPIADVRGRRAVLLPGLLFFILGSLVCLFSNSYNLFLFGRVLQAIGISTGQVVAAAVIGDIYTPEERGQAMGSYQTLIYLGPVLGPISGSLISAYLHWQWVFIVLAGLGALVLLYNRTTLKETLQKGLEPRKISLKTFKGVLYNRPAFALILLAFSQFYGYYALLVFLPSLLTELFKLPVILKGFFFAPLTAGILLGTIIGSKGQKKWRRTKIVNFTSYGISLNVLAVTLSLYLGLLNIPMLLIYLSIYGLLMGCSLPAQSTTLVNLFQEEKATAMGIYNSLRFFGASLGPIIGGFFLSWFGYSTLFLSLGALLIISALVIQKNLFDPYETE